MRFKSARSLSTTTALMAILFLVVCACDWREAAAQLKPEKSRSGKLEGSGARNMQKLPDLVVTNISYSGNTANISVHNNGVGPSKGCKLKFTLPGEQWTFNVPALLPKGFVHTETISRNKPFSGKGVAAVDFENQIVESNENNNVRTINQAASAPDLAAVQISFREEGGVSKIIGVIQNVGTTGFSGSAGKARLIRIAKYGAHQKITPLNDVTLPNSFPPGLKYEVKAKVPPLFPGADYYLWILVVEAGDANPANDQIEKKSVKFDNNN